jgi:nucleotide-binding universal stress UspA family protein
MKVVLAVDGSEVSSQAVRFLARLAHRDRMEITVVTVANEVHLGQHLSNDLWYPEYLRRQKEGYDKAYAEVEAALDGADVELHRFEGRGHVGGQIVDCAAREGARLIVLGAQGHSMLDRILLGSVSDYVATHAECSVLIVRSDSMMQPGTKRITVCYDGSEAAKRAIDQFLEFRWVGDVRVQALSVALEPPSFGEGFIPLTPDDSAQFLAHARKQAEEAAEKLRRAEVTVDVTAQSGSNVGPLIVEATKRYGSELIVLGDTGLSAVSRMLLGSVSRYVLRHAQQSVWIARHRQA